MAGRSSLPAISSRRGFTFTTLQDGFVVGPVGHVGFHVGISTSPCRCGVDITIHIDFTWTRPERRPRTIVATDWCAVVHGSGSPAVYNSKRVHGWQASSTRPSFDRKFDDLLFLWDFPASICWTKWSIWPGEQQERGLPAQLICHGYRSSSLCTQVDIPVSVHSPGWHAVNVGPGCHKKKRRLATHMRIFSTACSLARAERQFPVE